MNQNLNIFESGYSSLNSSLIILFMGEGPQWQYKVSLSSKGHIELKISLFIYPRY
jgi:hypothetical protein